MQISFFYGSQVIQSNPLTLNILPLPKKNQSDTFSGLVGTFTLDIEETTETVIENKPLAIRLKITGSGNIKQLSELVVTKTDTFKVYKSSVNDHITYTDSVKGTRHFEYIVVPKKDGNLPLPQFSFSYFSPKEKKYITLQTPKKTISILDSGDAATQTYSSPHQEKTKELRQDFRYIKESLHLNQKHTPFYKQWLALLLIAINTLLLISIVSKTIYVSSIVQNNLHRFAKKPDKHAIQTLQSLQKSPQTISVNDIQNTLYTYISTLIKRPAQALPKHELKTALEKASINSKDILSIESLLEHCNLMTYSPEKNSKINTKDLCDAAIIWIQKTKRTQP